MLSTDSGFKGNTILVFWQNLRTETRLRGTKALIPWPSSEHHRTKNILFQTCLECQTLKKDMKIASAVKLSCVGIKKQGKTSLNASISELLYPKKKEISYYFQQNVTIISESYHKKESLPPYDEILFCELLELPFEKHWF